MEGNSLSIFIVSTAPSVATDQGIVHADHCQVMLKRFLYPRVERFARTGQFNMPDDLFPFIPKLKNIPIEDQPTA